MTCQAAPSSRWDAASARTLHVSATYGSFWTNGSASADTRAFGVSSLEAETMDPQITLILQGSYVALHNRTIGSARSALGCRASLVNAEIGFFLGMGGSIVTSNTTSQEQATSKQAPSVYSGTSGALSVASGRVSYTLGLTGPCLSLDTACSSSLVALHLVVSALSLSECPRAAAAGIGLLTEDVTYAFSAAGMLSGLGRCHTLDQRADGYCRGEGCCTFVLDGAF